MHDTPRTLRRTTTENILCFLLVLTIAHFCFLWYHNCTELYNLSGYCAVDLSSSPVSRTARIVVNQRFRVFLYPKIPLPYHYRTTISFFAAVVFDRLDEIFHPACGLFSHRFRNMSIPIQRECG